MAKNRAFARGDVLPSYIMNAVQEFLSGLAPNFRIVRASGTTIRVPAGAGDAQVAVSINGRWRYVNANVDRAHPGGAAGTYDIFVTAAENSISNAPQPNTDNTNYSFALDIRAAGATPAIVAGTVDIFRKVGTLQWDGAQITAIDPEVGTPRPTDPIRPAPADTDEPAVRARSLAGQAVPTLRVETSGGVARFTAGDSGVEHFAAAAGTTVLRASVDGDAQPRLAVTAAGVLSWGPGGAVAADANLYRSAASSLKTDGALAVGGSLAHQGALLGFFNAAAIAREAGYGAALTTNFPGATSRKSLTSSYSMNDLRDVLATLVNSLRAYGLLGA